MSTSSQAAERASGSSFYSGMRILPPAQREAFAMLKLEGMTLQAAAGRAGISVGALKVRAHRAYKALRKMIGGEGESDSG